MCLLNDNEKYRVYEALEAFVRKGRPFSGYEVWRSLGDMNFPKADTSAYIRELFNGRNVVFNNAWAAWPTPAGFLLFFKVPSATRRTYQERISTNK